MQDDHADQDESRRRATALLTCGHRNSGEPDAALMVMLREEINGSRMFSTGSYCPLCRARRDIVERRLRDMDEVRPWLAGG